VAIVEASSAMAARLRASLEGLGDGAIIFSAMSALGRLADSSQTSRQVR
jgi:hypothetical protein